jgi:hypothetical protein
MTYEALRNAFREFVRTPDYWSKAERVVAGPEALARYHRDTADRVVLGVAGQQSPPGLHNMQESEDVPPHEVRVLDVEGNVLWRFDYTP